MILSEARVMIQDSLLAILLKTQFDISLLMEPIASIVVVHVWKSLYVPVMVGKKIYGNFVFSRGNLDGINDCVVFKHFLRIFVV